MTARCLLLAGSWGPERAPARPDGGDADWYLPLHVRDVAAARERIAAQIAAGADVVVAPTWLTHRRALLPLGETRHAAAWTTAAVRVAREAVEIGLERRESLLAETAPDDGRRSRPDPRVAAVLPALDEQPEAGSGRLPSREAAGRGHYRDQAGLLVDAEPDLLLVEGPTDPSEARVAADEAGATGLPVWVAISARAMAAVQMETWLEWGPQAGIERLLLPTLEAAAYARESGLAWGALATGATGATGPGGAGDANGAAGADATIAVTTVADWLAAGATVVARLDGASVAALEPLRAAIDEVERAAIEAARAEERRWLEHVHRAATMAPGGAALWLGELAAAPLPDGFEWLVVDPSETRRLPAGHYRLIVSRRSFEGAGELLERGGVLAQGELLVGEAGSGLRAVLIDDASAPLAIYRREA